MNVAKIDRELKKKFGDAVNARAEDDVLFLSGTLESWEKVVAAGKTFARRKGVRGVVNDVTVQGAKIQTATPPTVDGAYDGKQTDVAVIGGGVIGCMIARELAKWDISIAIIEKEYDVAVGASSRNDGMIHPGIDLHKGYRKLYYGPKGNAMYDRLAEELDVKFERRGGYLLFDRAWQRLLVPIFQYLAKRNRVPNVRYASRREIIAREPSVKEWCRGGIYTPSSGIISPYKLTVAAAENAVVNGAELLLNTAVIGMETEDGRITALKTNHGSIFPKVVIDAAGVYADVIADYANDRFFTIHPRRGTILILDKKANLTDSMIVRTPFLHRKHSTTKGGGIVRTIDGNILVGPDAVEQPDRDDRSTCTESIETIMNKHRQTTQLLHNSQIITYFSGTRACTYEEDFIVEPSKKVSNLVYAAGIQSPGLTAAPAIAEDVAKMTLEKLGSVQPRKDYVHRRKGIPHVAEMSEEERQKLIEKRPDYGQIVCRCEQISKGEIIDAIHSPVPATTIDAIKRRVRPGMGRCQGGFCLPLIVKIIREEMQDPEFAVQKGGNHTEIVIAKNKLAGGGGSHVL